jgi:hypothetical protein
MTISKQALEAQQAIVREMKLGPTITNIGRAFIQDCVECAIEAHDAAQWRPVSEPPDWAGRVWVETGSFGREAFVYDGVFYSDATKVFKLNRITHWRELPSAPKRKGEL